MLSEIQQAFAAGWAGEEEVFSEIDAAWRKYGYLADPHTAVALRVGSAQRAERPMVVLSTASPFKFSREVLSALKQPVPDDEFAALHALEILSGQSAPPSLAGLEQKPIRFSEVITPQAIEEIPLRLV
jgi:threonine synthase